jgi:hypothetical protein
MRTIAWLLAALAALPAAALAGRVYHVAPPPLGDDANAGDAGAPFATLEQARLAVRRELGARRPGGDIVVELAGGTYELPAPVRFDAADSGRPGAEVVYRAAPGAEVVLSGGRRVTGWVREPDGSWRADAGPGVDFRQLWVDGRRAVRARTPNAGRYFIFAADQGPDGFDVPREPLAGIALRPGEVEFSVLIAWMHKRLRLARVADSGAGPSVRAVIEPREWDAVLRQPQGDRVYRGRAYWLENAREFLDAPGEFFLDRTAGVLRYRPRPGEDLARAAVVRPELESLIVLAGTPADHVHHLRFEGLTFAHTGWTRPNRAGFVDVQANSLVPVTPAAAVDPQYRHNQRKDRVPAAFQAMTADHITLRGNRFARLGGTGVMFTHGGDDNIIERNSFWDIAAGGIELGEDAVRPADPQLIPRRNRIANNFLAHIGEDYFGSVAILGYYTDGSVIAHNEIVAVPYTAISQGWGWGNPPAPPDARANRIEHNRITGFMRRLDDGGGIYTTDRQPGSEIAFNLVERMLPPDPRTPAGGALYLDQFTEGFHVHHNVVSDAVRWLYIWNPNIRGNRVDANYADTSAQRNDGTDNAVEPVHVVTDGRWPEAAQAIRSGAGLEPGAADVRVIAAPADVIVESTDMDFAVVAGTWTVTDEPDGRYGANCFESTTPGAKARWTPVLPRDGTYEVAVWRPAGSAAAAYAVRHADGEAAVRLPAGGGGDWKTLGRFPFRAGIGGEVTISAGIDSAGKPARADAVRFTRVGP